MRKVFWYQYQDTGIAESECYTAAAGSVSPSWSASYPAQQAALTAPHVDVDWWYGLYQGDFTPNKALCTFQKYPAADAINICFGLTMQNHLPLVQANRISASANQ